MDNKDIVTINDLPTIEELEKRFERRLNAIDKRKGNPIEIMKYRNSFAFQFFSENFEMLESRDKNIITKTTRKLVQYGFFAFVVPTAINISLAKMTSDRIFNLPYIMRFSLRLGIFTVPLFFYSDYAFNRYTQVSMYLTDKYLERIERFSRVGDPKIINPYLEQELEEEV